MTREFPMKTTGSHHFLVETVGREMELRRDGKTLGKVVGAANYIFYLKVRNDSLKYPAS